MCPHREWRQGMREAACLLLKEIQQSHKFWYMHFMTALKLWKMTDAAEMLDIPELLGLHDMESSCHTSFDSVICKFVFLLRNSMVAI